ncbi:MAG: hypothetical protein ACTSXG_01805, partial [Alphaproteobacteria bacterium]
LLKKDPNNINSNCYKEAMSMVSYFQRLKKQKQINKNQLYKNIKSYNLVTLILADNKFQEPIFKKILNSFGNKYEPWFNLWKVVFPKINYLDLSSLNMKDEKFDFISDKQHTIQVKIPKY